jgi:hypothetical protein
MVRVMITSQKRVTAVCAPTGSGKCFSPDTPILLWGGEISPISEVAVGDKLVGPDGTPRVVTNVHGGYSLMFDVVPTKGTPHRVTSQHLLCTKLSPDRPNSSHEIADLSVISYLVENNTFRHRAKLYRASCLPSIACEEMELPLDPYFLGLWLGDGTQTRAAVTTADPVIEDYLYEFADFVGVAVSRSINSSGCPTLLLRNHSKGSSNPVTNILRGMCLLTSKSIPMQYKTAPMADRLRLLAGYLDADGYLSGATGFEASSSSRRLAHDIMYVARSLGMASYITHSFKSCQTGASDLYYRVSINGNTQVIPTLLARKQAQARAQIKDPLVTGFSVTSAPYGPYIGVEVDGPDHRFLLGDFTVVHNSATAVATALLSKQPTCIVTNSRGLQSQYMRLFESIGMVDIRGKRNYKCDMRPDDEEYTCEDGCAARCPYRGTVACPSSQAEMMAASSPLVVTNYDKWTASRKFGQGMSHFTQVIFDEGHDMYEALGRSLQVTLNHKEVEEGLKVDFPKYPDLLEFANWRAWAHVAKAAAENAMIAAQARITGINDPKPTWVRHFTHMRNLTRRLATLSTASAKDWIVDETEQGYQFDPIRPGKYAEAAMLLRVPRIIIMSATIRPKTLGMNGIGKDCSEFFEFDSDFDPRRCPIYYIPTMRVDSRAADLGPLWIKHDQIAARRQDRKGIVHTISYARRDEIIRRSRFADNMLINDKGEAPTEMIETFLHALPGTELVSPSIGTGYDFPGCVAPDTKVLRSDLRYVEARSLSEGDELVAFDEYPLDGRRTRCWRTAEVTANSIGIKECVRLGFIDGTSVVCSTDHPWLCSNSSHVAVWRAAGSIKPAVHQVFRLLDKFKVDMLGSIRPGEMLTVISSKPVGPQEVSLLSTTTSTYIADGLAAHNTAAEWQFICKIPFPDSRSKIIQARQADDKEYGPYVAMQKLVQMFGRTMRSKGDQSESFIGDEHMEWFKPRYGHLAPRSFHNHFRQTLIVPPPPPKLET